MNTMTALRQEMIHYMEDMPEPKLEALRPVVLELLAAPERAVFIADVTDEEKAMIAADYEEFVNNPQNFTELKPL